MTRTPSFRDVAQLSAYLDGQLKPSETARLEARLQTDPELASVLKDLRQARGVLRQLPQRRAPRNFTLTPKMVGLSPPMPRSYPAFRFATVLATLLLFFTFATNFMAPRMMATAPSAPYGMGGGYGGGADPEMEAQILATMQAESAAPAMEAPAMEEAVPAEEPAEPAMPAAEAPLPPAEPEMPVPAPTEGAAIAEDSTHIEPTAQPPAGETMQDVAPPAEEPYAQKSAPVDESMQEPTVEQPEVPFGGVLQIFLAGIAILSALITFAIRYNTIRKWRVKAR